MSLVKPPKPAQRPAHLDDAWKEYNRLENKVAKDPTDPRAYRRMRQAFEDYEKRRREVESHIPAEKGDD